MSEERRRTGVNYRKKINKFQAYINVKKKQYSLGYFDTYEEAVKARKKAELNVGDEFLDWYRSYSVQYRQQKKVKTNTSGQTGVSFCKRWNKFQTHISVNGKLYFLGNYKSYYDAVKARKEAELHYGKDFLSWYQSRSAAQNVSGSDSSDPIKTSENKICLVCGKEYYNKNKYCCSRSCYARFRQNYKTCVICGKAFDCPPSSAKICCSKDCSLAWKKIQHDIGIYDGVTENFNECRREYIKTHTGEKFHNAKSWKIQSPSGDIYECVNLMDFIKTHQEMFDGTVKQAFNGFNRMKQTQKGTRKKGKSYQWKGWRLLEWSDETVSEKSKA